MSNIQHETGNSSPRFGKASATQNGVRPHLLTAGERLAEIAEILAVGLMRLRARQSSLKPADCGESLLDCASNQSGHLASENAQ